MRPVTIAAAAVLLSAAVPASAQPTTRGPLEVTEAQSGRTINLRRGQALTVSVEACVGCPYDWRVNQLAPVLAQDPNTEVDHERRGAPDFVVGGSKTVQFHFTARRAGSGNLVLRYGSFVRRGDARGQRFARFRINVR